MLTHPPVICHTLRPSGTRGFFVMHSKNPASYSLKPLATTSKKAIASIPTSTVPQNTQSNSILCSFLTGSQTWADHQDRF